MENMVDRKGKENKRIWRTWLIKYERKPNERGKHGGPETEGKRTLVNGEDGTQETGKKGLRRTKLDQDVHCTRARRGQYCTRRNKKQVKEEDKKRKVRVDEGE